MGLISAYNLSTQWYQPTLLNQPCSQPPDTHITQKLQTSLYNCNQLPVCRITCEGPNEMIIQQISTQCGCMVEWGVHAAVLKCILVGIVFVLLNISR